MNNSEPRHPGQVRGAPAWVASNGRALMLLGFLCAASMLNGPRGASAAGRSTRSAAPQAAALVYAAIGPELREYELDVASATLSARGSVRLPQDIQAGCVSPSGRDVYVAWSNGTNKSPGSSHGLSAFRVDSRSNSLLSDGSPVSLPSRPIYATLDRSARHVLVAYTDPSGITVHPIAGDGRAGPAISQGNLRLGVYAHQVLVAPGNEAAILVSRGNLAAAGAPEDPGALDVLSYQDGLLQNRAAVAPHRGVGFHPRYVDFDPRRKWLFVSLSEQNELAVYALRNGGLDAQPQFEESSLSDPGHVRPGQLTGAVHVSPHGDFVYLVNRVLGATRIGGKPAFTGGENDIAVFRIDRRTGEPRLIQNVDTRGMVPGEFAFDPSGKILVLGNMQYLYVRHGHGMEAVPPSLALFRVRADGRLDFIRKYDVISGNHTLFWMGVGRLPR